MYWMQVAMYKFFVLIKAITKGMIFFENFNKTFIMTKQETFRHFDTKHYNIKPHLDPN